MATPISYLMTQVYISYLNITRYRYGNTSLLPQDTYISYLIITRYRHGNTCLLPDNTAYLLPDHHQVQVRQHLSQPSRPQALPIDELGLHAWLLVVPG